ncbi:DUF7287 family protein [Haloarcula onubensis]|uniref:Pilin/flagellin n=1 Tax=Haloarcula onubensis TaxID=2950539 RepID=A0ABU2FQE6_9EURY|nr:hypothetical protein [Halomicroarcula sp. S3CR25-11]MDS0282975.1 hypothetical protein [Halomicroarcula sp. S3CR25-11]
MMGERGQTTQDFAIGTSVMLVTIVGVFFFLQTGGLAVYEGTAPGVKQPQADRIATYLVENYTSEEGRNILRYDEPDDSGIDDRLADDEASGDTELSALMRNAGVDVSSDRRTNPIVNVSIVDGPTLRDGRRAAATDGDALHWGEYRQGDAATSTRVVQLDGYDCESVCWLVVRVW